MAQSERDEALEKHSGFAVQAQAEQGDEQGAGKPPGPPGQAVRENPRVFAGQV